LHAAGKVADELGATVVLAYMWLARGRPDRARTLLERALAACERHPVPLTTTGDVHVGLADLLREHGEIDSATEHLQKAQELGDRGSLPENRYRKYVVMADVIRARGDLDAAVELLDQAESIYLPGYFRTCGRSRRPGRACVVTVGNRRVRRWALRRPCMRPWSAHDHGRLCLPVRTSDAVTDPEVEPPSVR
jgi:tetratricopeptide (TPR) repeat protein